MRLFKALIICAFLFNLIKVNAQETLPIYSDYLSDNVFLVHPSAAGIGSCNKIRLTARTQWSGVNDAPALQTLNAHGSIGDNIGIGGVFFNDKNGYHSQQGFEGVFAYHINLGGYPESSNKLSFGLGLLVVNNSLDISDFDNIGGDPAFGGFASSKAYFNSDFSMAYHYKGLFTYFTAKNLILSARTYDDSESLNLRRYLFSLGYYFGKEKGVQFEPSILGQTIERTGEKFVDFNLKVYKKIQQAQLWLAFSYRQGFDSPLGQELQYFTPIVGVNYKNFMVSYTYTKQTGDILFDDAGYNQISIGFNFGCKTDRSFDWRYHPNLY